MTNQINSLHTPKYISIAEEINEKIDSGMNVGERIYSEKEIMEKYSVSSTTARKSLEVLRNGNIIERIQGKGTFDLSGTFPTMTLTYDFIQGTTSISPYLGATHFKATLTMDPASAKSLMVSAPAAKKLLVKPNVTN